MKRGGERVFLRNIIIIAVILAVAFLSQQIYFKKIGEKFNFPLFKKGNGYFSNQSPEKASDWLKANVYPRVSREVINRGELAKDAIDTQKNKLEEKSSGVVKKFVAEKVLQTLGVKPEELINSQDLSCPK